MSTELEELKKEIASLQERNHRVDLNKAWETSKTRIVSICVITYVTACLVLSFTALKSLFLAALMPPIGYFLSTQSLPRIKTWWLRRYYK